jgi:hypothetical protein
MIEWIKLGLSVLSFIGSIAVFVYVRSDRNQRATVKSITELQNHVNNRFSDVDKVISAKSERMARLEGEVKAIPTREQFDREREVARNEIIRIHERIDDIATSSQQSQLLLGQVLGELKQLNKGQSHG